MSLKTIKVNPIFLTTSGSKNNKTKKEKPAGVSLGQSNALKKKLIARIKNFQHNDKHAPQDLKSNNSNSNSNSREEEGFKDEFTNSMQFLDDLAKNKEEHKQTKRNNATLKKRHTTDPQAYTPQAYMQIATELPPELQWGAPPPPAQQATPPARAGRNAIQPSPFVPTAPSVPTAPVPTASSAPSVPTAPLWVPPPPPAYSNLKNSARPTYRTWLRTTQKIKPIVKNQPPIHILGDTIEPLQIVTQPQPLPLQVPSSLSSAEAPPAPAEALVAATPERVVAEYKPSLPRRKKITKTFKYKLGKHANGKVSVLIKNTHTRRKIQTEQAQLKRKSILDIKNHLRSKNFLKVGSNAPNDVLREMYEQSILAGQLENKAKETLIHNYFNEDK
jgi:hypothetical protein